MERDEVIFIEWIFIEYLSYRRHKEIKMNTAQPLLSKNSESRVNPKGAEEWASCIGDAILWAAVKRKVCVLQ